MKNLSLGELVLYGAVCAYLVALYIYPNEVFLGFTINALIIVILSIGWNLLGGFAGQMSFGHAALFGSGAYATAILQVQYGINPWISAVLAIFIATLVAGFIGVLAFRYGLKGSYFALVTLAFAEVLRILASSLAFTGGGQGILVPYATGVANFQFADRLSNYTFVLGLVIIAMLVTVAVKRSRFGAYLVAIRENEEAAKALGIDVFRTKVLAMMLSGTISGLAGVAYLQTYLFIDAPVGFGSAMSVEALLGPIIGGAGTIWGPVVGTLLLHLIGESVKHLVNDAPGLNLVLYGVVLLVILRYLPDGIIGLMRRLQPSTRRKALAAREAK
ncbi:branched-chain amino acid ABC transporter permease [Limoniibacter endophyticus]|uniref:Branched-chain amino acid ABC transporter permease n=1 Tax=Limoniibacter endophyticus TaxID=1565040 RepID=A0A8J3DN10_9HYPH|nr:branched-chain amino acid ABC transporter permease [Limoniibacter endophyticus]GHC66311.1 branched-chain amino acid ABC transporter permease [Limoniibacter endophyticus]